MSCSVVEDIKYKFDYIPKYKTEPCEVGYLSDACGNIFTLMGGKEFYKPDATKCKVPCGCLFPFGSINTIPYSTSNGYDIFVKTEKVIFPVPEGCEVVDIPIDVDDDKDFYEKCTVPTPKPDCPGLRRPILSNIPASYDDCQYDHQCVKTGEIMSFACSRAQECVTERALSAPACPAVSGSVPKCDLILFCPYPFPPRGLSANHTIKIEEECVECKTIFRKNCKDYARFKGEDDDPMSAKVVKMQVIKKGETYAFVYPNPFEQQISVTIGNNKSKIIKIELVDILGRIIQTYNAEGIEGENNFELNIPDSVSKGIYYLQITGEDYKLQYPIVHQ